jgi:hypothetical protein
MDAATPGTEQSLGVAPLPRKVLDRDSEQYKCHQLCRLRLQVSARFASAVQSNHGTLWPAPPGWARLWPARGTPDSNDHRMPRPGGPGVIR